MKKYISILILTILLVVAISLPIYAEDEIVTVRAKVIENKGITQLEEEGRSTKKVQNLLIRILEGEYEDEEYEMTYVLSEDIESIVSNIELNEKDNITVELEEKEGGITSITYKDIVDTNYTLYIVGGILLILLIIIGISTDILSIVFYLLSVIITSFTLIFSIKNGWNLILVSSIMSAIFTVINIVRKNKFNFKTIELIINSAISICLAGILINILFNVMGLTNINIKITDNFVNIKEMICSFIIVISCVLCNFIILVKLNTEELLNKPYKTKSDNIIEGQRSLKL